MVVEYLGTTDPRWNDLLRKVPHDVYHLPPYLQVSATYEGGKAIAFYVHDGPFFCLIPILIRRLPSHLNAPSDWCDITSPYGYAPPLFKADDTWIEAAMTTFITECRNRNIVSAFIRMHPLFPMPPVMANFGQLVTHGVTVYVDLTLTEEQLWSQKRERLRSYINRLRREGFYVKFDEWSTYGEFITLYRETMERLQANQFYHFSATYFRDLRDQLGDRLHYCSVFSASGELVCGALITETDGIVQYHLSGTSDAFHSMSPSKLMLHEVTLWAKRAGHRVLHLGGGVGGQADSLLQFKAGFSPLRSAFCTYQLVCDSTRYAALCQQHECDVASEDFFPQYRNRLKCLQGSR